MSAYLMFTRSKTPLSSGAEDLLEQDLGNLGIVIAEFSIFETAKTWFESSFLLERS
jgi:hypothetical protein